MKKNKLPNSPPAETDLVRLVQELEHIQDKLRSLDKSDEEASQIVEDLAKQIQKADSDRKGIHAANRRSRNLLNVQLTNVKELILPLVDQNPPIDLTRDIYKNILREGLKFGY